MKRGMYLGYDAFLQAVFELVEFLGQHNGRLLGLRSVALMEVVEMKMKMEMEIELMEKIPVTKKFVEKKI